MNNARELSEALLRMADKADRGEAVPAQVDAICRATDALIKLARLDMEVRFALANRQHCGLLWIAGEAKPALPEKSGEEPPRVAKLRKELAELDAAVEAEEEPARRRELEAKRKFAEDRIAHFLKGGEDKP